MRYMIAPLDLNIKELEVYKLLYKKMDFDTFEVKYTLDQIAQDSDNILELTKRKVDVIIKKFIELNYLNIVQKGVKGKPTIYKITKINELMCDEYVTNKEQICNEFRTNNEQINVGITNVEVDSRTNDEQIMNKYVANNEQMCDEYVTPIKDKDKDNIYKLIVDKWNNEVDLPKVKSITDKRKGAINARIKEHGKEAVIQVVENVSKSDFLQGKVGKWNNCNFDWSFKPTNFAKILEGNYDNKTTTIKEEKKEVKYNPDSEFKNLSFDELQARFGKA